MFTSVRQIYLACFLIAFFSVAILHAQTLPVSEPTWQELLARADSLRQATQYDSALTLAYKALEITERVYGKDDTSVAQAVSAVGDVLSRQGQHDKAESFYRRALAIREKTLSPDHPDRAQSLYCLAYELKQQERYAEAEPLYRRALAIREHCFGLNHPNVARILRSLALLLHDQMRYAEAEPLYRRALKINELSFGPDHPKVAGVLGNLALLLYDQGRFAEAEPLYCRALEIDEHSLGQDHPDVATDLGNLGVLYTEQARYAEAEPLFRRALEIRERKLGPEHPEVAKILVNLGSVYEGQGRYAEAEPLYRRAAKIFARSLGPENPAVAQCLNNLANLLYDQGRYSEAEPLYRRSLEIQERSLGSEHPAVAPCLNNLAILMYDQGRYSEAEPLYQRALQIREKALGSEHPDVASSLDNLAVLLEEQGRSTEAEPLYRRALEIRERKLGPEHPAVATSLNNLASLFEDQGRYAEAERFYRRSLEINERSLGSEHPDVAAFLSDLAVVVGKQRRYAEAEALHRRALEIQERSLGPDHPILASSLMRIALLSLAQGQVSRAASLAKRSWEISRQSFQDNHLVLAEKAMLDFTTVQSGTTSNYLTILDSAGLNSFAEAAAGVVLNAKGIVIEAISERQRQAEYGDSVTTCLADTLRYARFTLSRLYVDGLGEDSVGAYRHRLDDAMQEKERLERKLALRSVDFRKEQELWNVQAEKVAAAMPEGTVLVEFMVYNYRVNHREAEPRYVAVVLRAGGQPAVFPIGPASNIDSAVVWYRQQFRNPGLEDKAAYEAASEGLYSLVWRPFAALLHGARTVFIAPDGNLNLVSFAGLKDDDGKYLIEDYPIHYLSSGRDLIRLQDQSSPGSGMLAMGDPDYDLSFQKGSVISSTIANTNFPSLISFRNVRSGCQALKDLKVTRLPETRSEVDAVSSQWRNARSDSVVSYFGEDATEENFKQNAPGKRVIHLATHGYYISEECLPKQVVRGLSGESEGYVGENPLLLSGFLLAGANHHMDADDANREDGIVTAEDVAGLNLRGTDLVVLSTCESGLGTVKSGEGVYGLRRAFQMAGVRTVISALWQVDDKATADLMGSLFSSTGSSIPRSMQQSALRRLAKLRQNGQSDHPFYWAGFVATGGWETP